MGYMKTRADYDNFAWLYNQEWIEFIHGVFPLLKYLAGENLPKGAEALDLCCGTGQLASILTQEGFKVTGLDVSAGQLRYARKNAPQARFIRADARSFKLNQKYDTVFCTFDALNHILKLEELQQVFVNVGGCLKKGGVFIFDMNTIKEFLSHWDERQSNTEKPGFYYSVNISFDRAKKLGKFHVTMFRQSGKNWKRYDTTILETFYPRTSVVSALKKAGFRDIETFAANPREGITTPGKNATRIYYRAFKG
jgi:SAM-dependent methyltransferase